MCGAFKRAEGVRITPMLDSRDEVNPLGVAFGQDFFNLFGQFGEDKWFGVESGKS